MDLELEGVCLRFSPVMTAAGLGTRGEDVDQLVACIRSRLPVLTCTLQLREEFKQEVTGTAGLLYVDDPTWPGVGVVRYEHANDDKNSLKPDPEGDKIHAGLLKKLNELESDLTFKMGNDCFYKSTVNVGRTFLTGLKENGRCLSEETLVWFFLGVRQRPALCSLSGLSPP